MNTCIHTYVVPVAVLLGLNECICSYWETESDPATGTIHTWRDDLGMNIYIHTYVHAFIHTYLLTYTHKHTRFPTIRLSSRLPTICVVPVRTNWNILQHTATHYNNTLYVHTSDMRTYIYAYAYLRTRTRTHMHVYEHSIYIHTHHIRIYTHTSHRHQRYEGLL